MNIAIAPTADIHLAGLYRVIDAVAREGKYLAFTQAPPLDQSMAFYNGLLQKRAPYFVALSGAEVVGWCDVSPLMGETRAHIGTLGMGLLPGFRRQGLGLQLLRAAIAKSWANGLLRLELTVREDNHAAKALYEKVGFETEGLRRKGILAGGEFHGVLAMALLR